MSGEAQISELSISRDGISLKSVTINTLFTLAAAIGAWGAAYLVWEHKTETAQASAAFIKALGEQTQATRDQAAAMREQTCILKFDQKDRGTNAQWCQDISGTSRGSIR